MGLFETNCAQTSAALSDQLDGELQGLRRLRVGRHLGRCARCGATLDSLARLLRMLRTLGDGGEPIRSSLVGDVLVHIRQESRDGKREAR